MTQYGFFFDSEACIGCKTCQMACKNKNNLPVGNLFRRVYEWEHGTWEVGEGDTLPAPSDLFAYFIAMACNHCENPACVAVCPSGAMQKDPDTGIVWTDHDVCIGCKTCEAACPYGAPTYGEEEGYMLKCDMCRGEVAAGGKPICVTGCPMRALDFGTREEMIEKYGEGDVEVEPLPADTTGPNLILTPHRDAQKSGSGTGSVVNLEEEL